MWEGGGGGIMGCGIYHLPTKCMMPMSYDHQGFAAVAGARGKEGRGKERGGGEREGGYEWEGKEGGGEGGYEWKGVNANSGGRYVV